MAHIVAIVGRPNVGKSTLFNRLVGERKSIVDDISGVTRDRIYGESEWNGKTFNVIDTGGFVPQSDDVFEQAIRQQVQIAIEEASHIIFVTDATTGITDIDESIADILRQTNKPVFVAVNKVDNHERLLTANEFWGLGFDNTFFISAITGSGTGELLDALTECMPEQEESTPTTGEDIPKLAIVGRPNVGKSSLVNALVGEERNVVTDIPGTTRDALHTEFRKFDRHFILIYTAGLQKKSKIKENLEFYSALRTIKAIEEADVCLLMIDATRGFESQDKQILWQCIDKHKGIVVVVNKWDLIEKDTHTARKFEEYIRSQTAPFRDYPIVFTSVKEKQRLLKAVDAALEVYQNRKRRIKTSELNRFIQEITEKHPPPLYRHRPVRIKYATQLPLAYPAFVFFSNHPRHIKEPYRQFVENQLRKMYNFTGVPLTLYFRKSR